MRNGYTPRQASARATRRPAPEIEPFDWDKELARDERVRKLSHIAKELHRLEMTLWQRKGKFYVQSVPGTLTQELHNLLKECRYDLADLALSDGPVFLTTDDAMPASLAKEIRKRNCRGAQGWSEAQQFADKWGTAWLFPYRSLIDGAQQGLLPSGPVVVAERVEECIAERVIDDPALTVTQAAKAIAEIARATRGRAVPREVKAPLLKHFDTLRLIEEWRCRIECYL